MKWASQLQLPPARDSTGAQSGKKLIETRSEGEGTWTINEDGEEQGGEGGELQEEEEERSGERGGEQRSVDCRGGRQAGRARQVPWRKELEDPSC